VACEYFDTSLLDISAPFRKDLSGLDSFLIVMCLEGSGTLRCGSSERALHPDGCLLVPACESGAEFIPSDGGLKMLLCHL
jgi:mannose-6-phosphate isomerase